MDRVAYVWETSLDESGREDERRGGGRAAKGSRYEQR